MNTLKAKAANDIFAKTVWDVIFHALADQHHHPDKRGGGMIGKTEAVLEALNIDSDMTIADLKSKLVSS